MRYILSILIVVLLATDYSIAVSQIFETGYNDSLYHEGTKAVESGNYTEALEIWEQAVQNISADTSGHYITSPRIGIDYIELATRHKIRDHYRRASTLYYQGFKNCSTQYKSLITKEIKRLKPIAPEESYNQWDAALQKDISKVCSGIINFWKSLDPTFDTSYNERLLEHWERIAYARKNFNQSKSTVYEADDRAIIYVKLGKPDYTRSGNITFNKSMVRSWVYDAMDFQGVSTSSQSSDTSTGASSVVGGGSENSVPNMWTQEVEVEKYANRAEELHSYPQYDIWKYVDENRDENLIYIFGEDGNTGEFRMLRSLEEMIPSKAFRRDISSGSGLTPGFLLQLMFYQQTTIIDNYFADAFSELETSLTIENGLHSFTEFSNKSKNQSKLTHIQLQAPNQKSDYLKKVGNVSFNTFQYLLMNDQNQPYYATFVVSRPHKALFFDQAKQKTIDREKDYILKNSVQLLNSRKQRVFNTRRIVPIHTNETGRIDEMEPSTAYFEIPVHEYAEQVFSVELHNITKDSTEVGTKVFPEHIRAISTQKIIQKKHSVTKNDHLQMGDLMVGIQSEHNTPGPADFMIVHDRNIPNNQNIWVHFEVYNLGANTQPPHTFKVEYKVEPRNRNFLQRIFSKSDKVGLTLHFETSESSFREDLEIVTAPFKPGDYKLTLTVIGSDIGKKVSRAIPFTIEEE